jgi:FkbM family methyltransferase
MGPDILRYRTKLVRLGLKLLRNRRLALPAGAFLTTYVSLAHRRLCIVRYKHGAWEYHWPEGLFRSEFPIVHAEPDTPHHDLFFYDYQPKSGDIVIDVGAGLGEEVFALRTRVGANDQVFGFEAHPPTFAKLQELCSLNHWTHVEVINAALVDQPGLIFMSDAALYEANNIFSERAYEVSGMTLDTFVRDRQIAHIDYIKMNIEGAERLAVLGMEYTARLTDHICISCHDFLDTEWGRTSNHVRAWLEAHGFCVIDRRDDPRRMSNSIFTGPDRHVTTARVVNDGLALRLMAPRTFEDDHYSPCPSCRRLRRVGATATAIPAHRLNDDGAIHGAFAGYTGASDT